MGSTHVVEQVSFSMFPLTLAFDFDLILGSFLGGVPKGFHTSKVDFVCGGVCLSVCYRTYYLGYPTLFTGS